MSSNISDIFDGVPAPLEIEFAFTFTDDMLVVQDINNAVIQSYPNYLTLEGDTTFFNALNTKLSFLHSIHRIQPFIGTIDTFIRDSQSRIFVVELIHTQGVGT
jgi:hypothetical protein